MASRHKTFVVHKHTGRRLLPGHCRCWLIVYWWHSIRILNHHNNDLPLVIQSSLRESWIGFSDKPTSGKTAIFSRHSRSNSDEATETQPLAGLQGESGLGSLEGLRRRSRSLLYQASLDSSPRRGLFEPRINNLDRLRKTPNI